MTISIITVTCNSAATICNTFDSILQQTYYNIEYIVVDGASTDGTVDIIKEYEPLFNGRMKWISEKDNGLYDAMNKGIKLASGDVIGMLNSDDFYVDNEVIEDIVNIFMTHNTDSIHGNLLFVKENDTSKVVRRWIGSSYRDNGFKKGWHPAHPTFYVKREIYEKLGGFDNSFEVSSDFELMLRFIEKNKISTYYLDRYFIKMRMGGESTKSLKKIITGNINVLKAFKKNKIQISPLYPFYRIIPKIAKLLIKK